MSSFRLKIVLWYGLVVLATLVAFRLASVTVVRNSLYDDLDDSLRAEVDWVQTTLHGYRRRDLPDTEILDDIARRSRLSPRKEMIEIYDVRGRVYFRSPNLVGATLRSVSGKPPAEPVTIERPGGAPLRLLAARDSLFEVYVGYPTTDVDAAVDKVLGSFFVLIPLALLLVVGGGLLLLGRFVRPIRSLDLYAEDLLRTPLDDELPPPPTGPRDEIGRLVARIRDIVGRMRESLRRTLGFSSLASHELRTPLAVLRSQLEQALATEAGEEELRATLASTYDEVLRLGRVVEDLLSLATMQARTMKLDVQPIELGDFLADFAAEARLLCEERGIAFTLERSREATVPADPARLRQVLFNLLDNALRHTSPGGFVTLRLDRDDERAWIEMRDDGAGIPAADLPRVFDAFYRAQGSPRPTDRAGTGLGLTLVRWLVELHGGTVAVESAADRGTTFRIGLPL